MSEEGDIELAPVNMGQAMAVAAAMCIGLFNTFVKPEDAEKTKRDTSLICLAILLQQLTANCKFPNEVATVLHTVAYEVERNAQTNPVP